MEHHQLGRTGVSVSKLCLGAMMFGDWGNKTTRTAPGSSTVRSTPASAHRPRPPGQGPLHRLLGVSALGDRAGAMGGARAGTAALRVRATAVLDARPRDRGRRPTDLRESTGWV
jgi:hypothetical protein